MGQTDPAGRRWSVPEGLTLAIVTGEFERVADAVAERTADVLGTCVCVVDDRGVVIASSDTHRIGAVLSTPEVDGPDSPYLEVPLRLNQQHRRVVISRQHDGAVISTRLARSVVELIADQTAVVDRLPNKHELKNTFIHKLLQGATDDEAAILREAQILGMDLSPPRAVILIDAAGWILEADGALASPSEQLVRQRAQVIIGSVVDFFELPSDTICAYIGDGEVAVLKASNKRNLSRWVGRDRQQDLSSPSWANLAALERAGEALLCHLRARVPVSCRSSLSIGIGRYHPGLNGLATSYQDARVALSLGRRFCGRDRVHCLDRLGIAAFVGVADERTKIDLARYLISPLDHEPELLGTLNAFFAHGCCPSSTARDLSIHRNTLSYRLDKITSLTGLDPRCFDDAVQIRLALVLRSLASDHDACAGDREDGSVLAQHDTSWEPARVAG